jgi:hypothetical protein
MTGGRVPAELRIKRHATKAFRGLQLALALLLFAAGGGQPIGLGLVAQQIEMIGARQWLGLMAGSAMAPLSERVAAALPGRLAPAAAQAHEVGPASA